MCGGCGGIVEGTGVGISDLMGILKCKGKKRLLLLEEDGIRSGRVKGY